MKYMALFVAGVLVGVTLLARFGIAQNGRVSGLNHVGIVVASYDEALAFYTEAMEFKEAYTIRRPGLRITA